MHKDGHKDLYYIKNARYERNNNLTFCSHIFQQRKFNWLPNNWQIIFINFLIRAIKHGSQTNTVHEKNLWSIQYSINYFFTNSKKKTK